MVRKNVFSQVGLFWPFFWSDGYNNKQIENDPFTLSMPSIRRIASILSAKYADIMLASAEIMRHNALQGC
jgi:hypothetical protein